MLKKLSDHPVFTVIGGIIAVVGVVAAVLGLTKPEHPWVEKGELYGYNVQQNSTRPHRYKQCENPNKVTGYRFKGTVSKSSGWEEGGKDTNWH